jgi:hypothetical protein
VVIPETFVGFKLDQRIKIVGGASDPNLRLQKLLGRGTPDDLRGVVCLAVAIQGLIRFQVNLL